MDRFFQSSLRSTAFILLPFLILLNAYFNQAEALENEEWIEVRSDNFIVRSVLSETETIDLIRHFEIFRGMTFVLTNIKPVNTFVPTEIYVLGGYKEIAEFGIPANEGGIFTASIRKNFILLKDKILGVNESNIIQHEYAHFLLRNSGSTFYPKWFHEGFANYLGTARTEGEIFRVGRFPIRKAGNMRNQSRRISIERLLDPGVFDTWSKLMASRFYDESWAMVQILHPSPKNIEIASHMATYLSLREMGDSNIEAFEKAFDIKAEKFSIAIKKFILTSSRRINSFTSDSLLPGFEPKIVQLSREQASLGLAKIALNRGNIDKARYWYNIAWENEELRSQSEAGLGNVLKSKGEYEEALTHYLKAVELDPNDYLVQLDLGEYWYQVAVKDKEIIDSESLLKARSHYENAWKLESSMPEVYSMLGRTYLHEGEDVEEGIKLLEIAQSRLPSYLPNRLILAEGYFLAGQYEKAISASQTIISWAQFESDIAAQANEIVKLSEKREERKGVRN